MPRGRRRWSLLGAPSSRLPRAEANARRVGLSLYFDLTISPASTCSITGLGLRCRRRSTMARQRRGTQRRGRAGGSWRKRRDGTPTINFAATALRPTGPPCHAAEENSDRRGPKALCCAAARGGGLCTQEPGTIQTASAKQASSSPTRILRRSTSGARRCSRLFSTEGVPTKPSANCFCRMLSAQPLEPLTQARARGGQLRVEPVPGS